MSEAATPPKADPGAEGAAAAPAPAKPKDAPIWMLALVVVLALGAGGALGSLLVAPRLIKAKQAAAVEKLDPKAKKKKKKDDAKKAGGEHAGKPTNYRLENIVVNPADSQGQRFLMCSLAIESDDDKALELLREHEVELRDRVVTTLTSMTLDQLTAAGARDSIRFRLVQAIRPVLGEDGQDVELKVYLPSFVIQ